MNNVWLKLYSNCIIYKGAKRAVVYDLQRKDLYPIPLSLAELFDRDACLNTETLKISLDEEARLTLDEYVHFLIKNELAFFCTKEELAYFPKLSEEWLFPAHISNAVLDTHTTFDYFNHYFLDQLEKLCCNQIQFRYFNPVPIADLVLLLEILKPTQIKSFEIILPECKEHNFYDELFTIMEQHKKISNITVSNAGENKMLKEGVYGMGFIFKTTQNIESNLHCGLIAANLFSVNIPTVTESLAHNTCLNRKISIDTEGNIKNCPSMKESFGNIRDTTLEEAINKPGFKKYWNIKKDDITKCKDCEFRHVCTDCRAYLDNPEDMYSAPLKCGYDPYTCTWEEWSTHPMKQNAIDHYGMREIIS